jgi:hypothetical protein
VIDLGGSHIRGGGSVGASATTVHFDALPEAARRRLIASAQGRAQPSPILFQKTGGWTRVAGRIGAGLLLVGGCATLLATGFGDIDGAGRQGPGLLAVQISMAWLAGWAFLAAARGIVSDRAVPVPRGRYLFPTDLIVATEPVLRIFPLDTLERLDPIHVFRSGVYVCTDLVFRFEGGHREVFAIGDRAAVEHALHVFRQAGQLVTRASGARDTAALRELDVLAEARERWSQLTASGAAPPPHPASGPSAGTIPAALRWAPITALAVAALAVPAWLLRNNASDERAFERAVAQGSSTSLAAYLEGDGIHRGEVEAELLPAAAFREARAVGTVTALRDFVLRFPRSRHVADARQAIHGRFEQVRTAFMTQASTTDPAMPAFMGDLLLWLEANDSPSVLVRFNAPTARMLDEIDRNLPRNTSPVAPHFTPERTEPRERNITGVLRRGFAAVFPDDVMRLEHFGRLTPATPVETAHATFDVSYTVRPSGSIYVDDASGRHFIGITNDFSVRMSIPGAERTYSFQVAVEPPELFDVGYQRYGSPEDGPPDGTVYTTMSELAFAQLGTQLPLVFFRPGTPAHVQAVSDQPASLEPIGAPGLPPGLPDIPIDVPDPD